MKKIYYFVLGIISDIKKFSSFFIVNFLIFTVIQIAYTSLQIVSDITDKHKNFSTNSKYITFNIDPFPEKIGITEDNKTFYYNLDKNILYNSALFFVCFSIFFLGNVVYFLFILRDVRTKDLLKFSKEMADVSRIVTLMLSENLQHQMKTPLANIGSDIFHIQELIPQDSGKRKSCKKCSLTEECPQLITAIEKTLDDLKILQSSIETVKESNSLDYSDKKKTIGEILFDAISFIKKGSSTRLNSFDIEITKEMNKYVLVDISNEIFLDIILSHIKNSIEANSSKITIASNDLIENGILKIYIIDNGSGINEKDVPFLYDLKFPLKKDKNEEMVGTELFLSREILRQYENCDEKLLKTSPLGTTFEIKVPAKERHIDN